MNALCFTLEGSTESIYEPACSHAPGGAPPEGRCGPALLTRRPECGGPDSAAAPGRPQNGMELKQSSKWLCAPASAFKSVTSDGVVNHACCTSPADSKDASRQKKIQSRETRKASCHNIKMGRGGRREQPGCDRAKADPLAQESDTAANTAPAPTTGRLKKLQNLVQTKKDHSAGAGRGASTCEKHDNLQDVLSNSIPALTCIGLGKRTEKPCEKAPSPQQKPDSNHETSQEEGAWSPNVANSLWSPFECPQPWTPFYHTCHRARPELWVCGGTVSLPRTAEWERFESLIREIDNKQCGPSPPQMIRSITDLHLSQSLLTRFGRFDACKQQPPLMKLQDDEGCLQQQERNGDPTQLGLRGKQTEGKPTAIINGNQQINEASKQAIGGGRPFTSRRFSNSLESLYSLNSGQSSSSGVTSGSDCSSNRGSLRLEDDLLYTRRFCGRARVHTDHVPSPYDTESLKLKVGDVIDIISRPPMGIWTGMLNGRVGNFKFIYVDMLTSESPETHGQRARQKSTVQEVLKRLSLEEYSCSLQLHGYQTVDDLISLKEHHLTELNVTDPEHKHRLLAAVDCLRQLHCSDSQSENEVNQEAKTPQREREGTYE